MRAEVFICDYCGKQIDLTSDACLGALHFRDPIECGEEGPDYPCYAHFIHEKVQGRHTFWPSGKRIADKITGKMRSTQSNPMLDLTGCSFCSYEHLSLYIMDRANELLSLIQKEAITTGETK